MIKGERLTLRLVRETDLNNLYEAMSNLDTRGDYFPLGLMSESKLRSRFAESGFWGQEEGMLLIEDPDGQVVGEIEFFPITSYLSGYELSYQLFGDQFAGKGYTTEAVRILTQYLLGRKRVNRIQLNIHPGNSASKRVAEKAGYEFESIMKQCWYHQGQFHDLEIWSYIRSSQS